jgi:hypothetical protein
MQEETCGLQNAPIDRPIEQERESPSTRAIQKYLSERKESLDAKAQQMIHPPRQAASDETKSGRDPMVARKFPSPEVGLCTLKNAKQNKKIDLPPPVGRHLGQRV